MMVANVLWAFHGAFLVQFLPLFLLVEWYILIGFFPKVRKLRALGIVSLANLGSSVCGMFLVTLGMPMFRWDGLTQRASDQFLSCIVAFVITLPLEYKIVRSFKEFGEKKPPSFLSPMIPMKRQNTSLTGNCTNA